MSSPTSWLISVPGGAVSAPMAPSGAKPAVTSGSRMSNAATLYPFQPVRGDVVFYIAVRRAPRIFRVSAGFGERSRASPVVADIIAVDTTVASSCG